MATVDISINNKTYNGVSVVNLPLSDGSGYAPFNLDASHIITKCSITYNLTDVTSTNTANRIVSGTSYTTTLSTSLSGRKVSGVIVTMGGVTQSGVYNSSTGVITIAEVTGDIVITATTAEDASAPAFALATPLVLGDTTDTRINDTANNRVATGITVNDNEDWTICVEFTSKAGVAAEGTTIFKNNNNQHSLEGYTKYVANWHGRPTSDIVADCTTVVNGVRVWTDFHFIAIITHVANALTLNVYGTTETSLTLQSIATAASGQLYVGSDKDSGTINRFALYKRVLDSNEIADWIGA